MKFAKQTGFNGSPVKKKKEKNYSNVISLLRECYDMFWSQQNE